MRAPAWGLPTGPRCSRSCDRRPAVLRYRRTMKLATAALAPLLIGLTGPAGLAAPTPAPATAAPRTAPPPIAGVTPVPGDYTIKNFAFTSGEKLPEVRLHYATLGTPKRDAAGRVTNAVVIL